MLLERATSASMHGLLAGPTEADAVAWVRRKLGSAAHERRVLATAARLFDLTRDTLGLDDADAELLRLAALTHDIGRSISDKDHPELGAAMIEKTTALDLSPATRRRLAFLAHYHRGATPPVSGDPYLAPTDARRPVRAVLALLRTADALDHRHLPAARLVLSFAAGRLSVRCVVAADLARARRVYTRPKKYRMLEAFLGHTVRVTVEAETTR